MSRNLVVENEVVLVVFVDAVLTLILLLYVHHHIHIMTARMYGIYCICVRSSIEPNATQKVRRGRRWCPFTPAESRNKKELNFVLLPR